MEDERPMHWDKLEDDFKNKRSVVLFVGTGINFPSFGNDKNFSWDALLNHLMSHSIQLILPSNENTDDVKKTILGKGASDHENLGLQQQANQVLSRMTKTTLVKQTLKNTSFVNLIQDFLYRQCPHDDLKKACDEYLGSNKKKCVYYSLFQLADMILHYPNIKAVVTQNYDRFLEDAIELLSEKYDSVGTEYIRRRPRIVCGWKNDNDFSTDSFNIYHVHGYIPRYYEIQAPKNNTIVLSLDEFYEDSRNVYSWQISSQIHFLSQYTCIFCGLSLDDYTSQRLLHYVKDKHKGNLYYITAIMNAGKELDILYDIKNRFHSNNGMTVICDEQGFNHIYELLGELKYGK